MENNNEKADLRTIADSHNLQYIETTSQPNGYPSNIKGAIIGFDSFDEAQKLADEYNLSIEFFTKKDGWQLWYRTGNTAHEPMKNSSADYGENYSELEKMIEEEFYKNEIKDSIENFDNLSDLQKFLSEKEKLFNEIDNMEDDEIVITCQGKYYETIKKTTMYFSHDTKHTVIGLIDRN